MNDVIISALRRLAVSGVAFVLTWLAVHLGVGLDGKTSAALTAFVSLLLVAAYGWAAQQLEKRYPWLGKVLFLGASQQVTYTKHGQ